MKLIGWLIGVPALYVVKFAIWLTEPPYHWPNESWRALRYNLRQARPW